MCDQTCNNRTRGHIKFCKRKLMSSCYRCMVMKYLTLVTKLHNTSYRIQKFYSSTERHMCSCLMGCSSALISSCVSLYLVFTSSVTCHITFSSLMCLVITNCVMTYSAPPTLQVKLSNEYELKLDDLKSRWVWLVYNVIM